MFTKKIFSLILLMLFIVQIGAITNTLAPTKPLNQDKTKKDNKNTATTLAQNSTTNPIINQNQNQTSNSNLITNNQSLPSSNSNMKKTSTSSTSSIGSNSQTVRVDYNNYQQQSSSNWQIENNYDPIIPVFGTPLYRGACQSTSTCNTFLAESNNHALSKTDGQTYGQYCEWTGTSGTSYAIVCQTPWTIDVTGIVGGTLYVSNVYSSNSGATVVSNSINIFTDTSTSSMISVTTSTQSYSTSSYTIFSVGSNKYIEGNVYISYTSSSSLSAGYLVDFFDGFYFQPNSYTSNQYITPVLNTNTGKNSYTASVVPTNNKITVTNSSNTELISSSTNYDYAVTNQTDLFQSQVGQIQNFNDGTVMNWLDTDYGQTLTNDNGALKIVHGTASNNFFYIERTATMEIPKTTSFTVEFDMNLGNTKFAGSLVQMNWRWIGKYGATLVTANRNFNYGTGWFHVTEKFSYYAMSGDTLAIMPSQQIRLALYDPYASSIPAGDYILIDNIHCFVPNDYATNWGSSWSFNHQHEYYTNVYGQTQDFTTGLDTWSALTGVSSFTQSGTTATIVGSATTTGIQSTGISINTASYGYFDVEFSSNVALTQIMLYDSGGHGLCSSGYSGSWSANVWYDFECPLGGTYWTGTLTSVNVRFTGATNPTVTLNLITISDSSYGNTQGWFSTAGNNHYVYTNPNGYLVDHYATGTVSDSIALDVSSHNIDTSVYNQLSITLSSDSSSSRYFQFAETSNSATVGITPWTALSTTSTTYTFDLSSYSSWAGSINQYLRIYFASSSGGAVPTVGSVFNIRSIILSQGNESTTIYGLPIGQQSTLIFEDTSVSTTTQTVYTTAYSTYQDNGKFLNSVTVNPSGNKVEIYNSSGWVFSTASNSYSSFSVTNHHLIVIGLTVGVDSIITFVSDFSSVSYPVVKSNIVPFDSSTIYNSTITFQGVQSSYVTTNITFDSANTNLLGSYFVQFKFFPIFSDSETASMYSSYYNPASWYNTTFNNIVPYSWNVAYAYISLSSYSASNIAFMLYTNVSYYLSILTIYSYNYTVGNSRANGDFQVSGYMKFITPYNTFDASTINITIGIFEGKKFNILYSNTTLTDEFGYFSLTANYTLQTGYELEIYATDGEPNLGSANHYLIDSIYCDFEQSTCNPYFTKGSLAYFTSSPNPYNGTYGLYSTTIDNNQEEVMYNGYAQGSGNYSFACYSIGGSGACSVWFFLTEPRDVVAYDGTLIANPTYIYPGSVYAFYYSGALPSGNLRITYGLNSNFAQTVASTTYEPYASVWTYMTAQVFVYTNGSMLINGYCNGTLELSYFTNNPLSTEGYSGVSFSYYARVDSYYSNYNYLSGSYAQLPLNINNESTIDYSLNENNVAYILSQDNQSGNLYIDVWMDNIFQGVYSSNQVIYKSSTVGIHTFSYKLIASDNYIIGGSTFVNSTYSVVESNYETIIIRNQQDQFINPNTFNMYYNGVQFPNGQFYDNDTSATFNLTIADPWGYIVYQNLTEPWVSIKNMVLNVYNAKVQNAQSSPIWVNIQRGTGASYSQWIFPQEVISYWLLPASNYTIYYHFATVNSSYVSITNTTVVAYSFSLSADIAFSITGTTLQDVYSNINAVLNQVDTVNLTINSLYGVVNDTSATTSLIFNTQNGNFSLIANNLTIINSGIYGNFTALTKTLSILNSTLQGNFTLLSQVVNFTRDYLNANFTTLGSFVNIMSANITGGFTAVDSYVNANFTFINSLVNFTRDYLNANFSILNSLVDFVGTNMTGDFNFLNSLVNFTRSYLNGNFSSMDSLINIVGANITGGFSATNSYIDGNFTFINSLINFTRDYLNGSFASLGDVINIMGSNLTGDFNFMLDVVNFTRDYLNGNFSSLNTYLDIFSQNVTVGLNSQNTTIYQQFDIINSLINFTRSYLNGNFSFFNSAIDLMANNINGSFDIINSLVNFTRDYLNGNLSTLGSIVDIIGLNVTGGFQYVNNATNFITQIMNASFTYSNTSFDNVVTTLASVNSSLLDQLAFQVQINPPYLSDSYVNLYAVATKPFTYTIYENDTLVGSGTGERAGSTINYARNSNIGVLIEVAVKFVNGTDIVWDNFTYSNAAMQALLVAIGTPIEADNLLQLAVSSNYANTQYWINDSLVPGLQADWVKQGVFAWDVNSSEYGTHSINVTARIDLNGDGLYTANGETYSQIVTWNYFEQDLVLQNIQFYSNFNKQLTLSFTSNYRGQNKTYFRVHTYNQTIWSPWFSEDLTNGSYSFSTSSLAQNAKYVFLVQIEANITKSAVQLQLLNYTFYYIPSSNVVVVVGNNPNPAPLSTTSTTTSDTNIAQIKSQTQYTPITTVLTMLTFIALAAPIIYRYGKKGPAVINKVADETAKSAGIPIPEPLANLAKTQKKTTRRMSSQLDNPYKK